MNDGAVSSRPTPPPDTAAPIDEEGAVKRLRASRISYRQNLELDAKKAGARWLMTFATYEQVMFLLAVRSGDRKDDALQLDHAAALFEDIEKHLDRVSEVAQWSRDEGWLDAFIDAALGRWKDISAKVETGEPVA